MAVKIFYCYAHEDRKLREGLEKHLAILKRQELITDWYDRNINAAKDWAKEIDIHLDTADIILLLISPDFMNSDYCYSVEMTRALERHENGTARVIPIILHRIVYEGALFSHLQALPTDAIPITDRKWHTRNEAFFDVAQGIQKVVKELLCEQSLYEGNIHFFRQQYDEALTAFEQAIYFGPTNALAYIGKGRTLNLLASDAFLSTDFYKSALAAFEKALCLDSSNSHAYEGKGKALFMLDSWDNKRDALSAYEQAIRFDPKNEAAYIGKGTALMQLSRDEEALDAFEQAIEVALFPNQDAYKGMELALYNLKRYTDALAACEQLIHVFPNCGFAYEVKGNAYYNLERYEEALVAYNKALSLGCNSALLYNFLGNALYRLGYNQESLDAFEKAILLNSDLSDAYSGKGHVLKLLAEKAFEEANKLDPLSF